MRSANHKNLRETYTRLNRAQMARLALVTGLFPKFKERKKYLELVKEFNILKGSNIQNIFEILLCRKPTEKQKNYLDDILGKLHYNSNTWKQMDYDSLESEGVIINTQGSITDLIEGILNIDENKVVSTKINIINPYVDYLKHVKPKNRIVMNSKDVIKKFAYIKKLKLPAKYLKSGYINSEVHNILKEKKFTFPEAFKSAIDLIKEPRYRDREISVFVIKRRNGDEVRIFPYDIIAGTELFYEITKYRPEEIRLRHGKITDEEFKYHGENIFEIPKRNPKKNMKYNEVTTNYLPDVFRPRDLTLEWINTIMRCNCDWSLNTRNFEIRRGRMTRTVTTHDIHSRVVILYLAKEKKKYINNPTLVYPTHYLIKLVDKFRNNLIVKNRHASVIEINLLTTELFKKYSYYTLFRSQMPEEKKVIRPLYP